MKKRFQNTRFYQGWKRLIEDMRPMSFWKKVDHLWTYYKIYLVFVGVIVLMSGIFISFFTKQSQDELVRGMLVNIYIDQEGYNYLTTDYETYLGAEEDQIVTLTHSKFGNVLDQQQAEINYNQSLIMVARVSGSMLDYAILDQYAMEYYIDMDVYLDLREFFTTEELEAMTAENRVIYARAEGETETWPLAVDITDTQFAKDNINNEGKVYFALSGNQPNLDMCRNVWDYIHAWKPEA